MALTAEEIRWYKSFATALRKQGIDPNDKLALSQILVRQDMRSHAEKIDEYTDGKPNEITQEMQNQLMSVVVEELRARYVPAFTKPSSDGLMKLADLNDNRSASNWLEDETMIVDEAKINPDGTGLGRAEEEKVKALFDFAKNGRLFFSETSLPEESREHPIVVDANGEAVVREYNLTSLFDRKARNEKITAEEEMIHEVGMQYFDLIRVDNITPEFLPKAAYQSFRQHGLKISNRSELVKDMIIYSDLYRDPVTRQERIAELELGQEQFGREEMIENRSEGKSSEETYIKEAAMPKGEALKAYLRELYGTKPYSDSLPRRNNVELQISALKEMLAEIPEDEPGKRQVIQNRLNGLTTPEGRQQTISELRAKLDIMKELKRSGNKAISGSDISKQQFLISSLENYEADKEIVENAEAVGGYLSGRRTSEEGVLPRELEAFLAERMPKFVPTAEIYSAAEEYNVPKQYDLLLGGFSVRKDALGVNEEDYFPVFLEEAAAERLKSIANNTRAQRFSANVLIEGQPVLLDIAEMGMNMTREQELAFVSGQVANAMLYGKKVQIIPTDKEGTPLEPVDFVPQEIPILDAEHVRLRTATHFNMFNEKDPQKAVNEVGDLLREAKAADRFVLFGKEQFANMLTAMDELNTMTQRMSQNASLAGVEQMEEYRKALDKANKAAETYIKYKGVEGKNGTETRRINAALAIKKYTSEKTTSVVNHVKDIMAKTEKGKTEIAKEECADKLYNAYMKRLQVMKSESTYNALNTEKGRNAFMEAAKNSKLVNELAESPERMEENPQKLVDLLMSELVPKKTEPQAKEPQRQINEPQKSADAPAMMGP